MKHAYYLSNDLDELESVHDELVQMGLKDRYIHVLSEHEAEVEKHHLRNVNDIAKTDMLGFMAKGAACGAILVLIVGAAAYVFDYGQNQLMAPIALASLFLFGFCVWEAGLIGLHKLNHRFKAFEKELHRGEHVLILDYENEQAKTVKNVARAHPKLHAVNA